MNMSMLMQSDVELAHSLPVTRDNTGMDAGSNGRLGVVPEFQGFESEMEQMQIIQRSHLECGVWAELEPLAELAKRVVNELEAEHRDLRFVTLDEMKHRMVVARRAQLMAS